MNASKIIIKIVLFFICLFCLIQLQYHIDIKKKLSTNQSKYLKVLNLSKDRIDMLIIGASRADKCINTDLLLQKYHINCINAGIPQVSPEDIALTLKTIDKQDFKYDTLILTLEIIQFVENQSSDYKTHPYFYIEKRHQPHIKSYYKSELGLLNYYLFKASPAFLYYRYNSVIDENYSEFTNKESKTMFSGYSECTYNPYIKENTLKIDYNTNQTSQKNLRFLREIINLCQKNSTMLFCVTLPYEDVLVEHFNTEKLSRLTSNIQQILSEHHFKYYNLNEDLLLDSSHFCDALHLNREASNLATELVYQKIRGITTNSR